MAQRNYELWEIVNKKGGVAALAKHCDMSIKTTTSVLNGTHMPTPKILRRFSVFLDTPEDVILSKWKAHYNQKTGINRLAAFDNIVFDIKEVADVVGITHQTMLNYITLIHIPPKEIAIKIAEYCGVDPLIFWDEVKGRIFKTNEDVKIPNLFTEKQNDLSFTLHCFRDTDCVYNQDSRCTCDGVSFTKNEDGLYICSSKQIKYTQVKAIIKCVKHCARRNVLDGTICGHSNPVFDISVSGSDDTSLLKCISYMPWDKQ